MHLVLRRGKINYRVAIKNKKIKISRLCSYHFTCQLSFLISIQLTSNMATLFNSSSEVSRKKEEGGDSAFDWSFRLPRSVVRRLNQNPWWLKIDGQATFTSSSKKVISIENLEKRIGSKFRDFLDFTRQ